jgi:broad specificity phosphatase PhoE
MSSYLRHLISLPWTWVLVLWVYVVTGWRFWCWRWQLWLHPGMLLESIDTSMKQTLLFIRHGETSWNVEHRLPGQLPGISLNEKGVQQVKQLAEALNAIPVSAIISSPLERACETAQILAEGRDLRVYMEPDLMDTQVGAWAGKTIDEVSKNDPAWKEFVRNPLVAPEGVETFSVLQERVLAAVERWRTTEDIGAYPAFVAHADVIKVLLAHYLPIELSRAPSLMIDNASVSLVALEQDHQPRVIAVGWSPRPGWLKPPIPEPQKTEEVKTEEVGRTENTGQVEPVEVKDEEQKE